MNIDNNSNDSDVSATYYFDLYDQLHKFIDNVQIELKHELEQILYPIFIHFYLELISKDMSQSAVEFFDKYSTIQADYHKIDINQLKLITNAEQLTKSEFKDAICSDKFNVKFCEDSYRLLKDFVRNKNSKKLIDIIKEKILIELYNGEPRDAKQQLICAGGVLGETNSNKSVAKMYYGLLKEPDLHLNIEDNDDANEEESEKPKKKKKNKEALSNKKNRQDPNAPAFNRIPLPEFREIDRFNRQQMIKDFRARARLGPEKLPSICFYTILNSYNTVNCCEISDDSVCLAVGLSDSTVRVYTLVPNKKLKLMKQFHDLELLDKDSDDVFSLMFDETSGTDYKTLIGHAGPVFSVAFSPDKYHLISGSEDGGIRMWCLLTYSALVCYKGHNGPVWDVKFGPYNHYFASCGADKTARLWSIDQPTSLKIYIDHLSDVDCICFHPNSNYLATGCSDRNIRIIDLASTSDNAVVRQLTGHKNSINIMKFSYCGRFLASGGQDASVYLWDVATPVIVAQFNTHKDAIYSLDFSRDNVVLASGGLDNTIKIWHIAKLTKDIEQSEDPASHSAKFDSSYEIGSFRTKQTPTIHLHFTRRNLLVGIGSYTGGNTQ